MNDETKDKANFTLYLLATIIPIILLSVTLSFPILDHIKQYRFTQKELIGIQVIESLYDSLTESQKIRGYTQIALWNSAESPEKLQALKSQFLARLQQEPLKQQVDQLNLQDEFHFLDKQAQQLFLIKQASVQSADLFTKHTSLITTIL